MNTEQMYLLLRDSILRNAHFTAGELDLVMSFFKVRATVKNERLLSRNDICKNLYFVCRGYIRIFNELDNGNDITRFVAFENEFGTAMPSFICQAQSAASIDTPEDSYLLHISHSDFHFLLDSLPQWERIYRINLEKAYIASVQRVEMLTMMSAREGYEFLLSHFPQVVQRLSNKNLASYLGIKQETLSRLKSRR